MHNKLTLQKVYNKIYEKTDKVRMIALKVLSPQSAYITKIRLHPS